MRKADMRQFLIISPLEYLNVHFPTFLLLRTGRWCLHSGIVIAGAQSIPLQIYKEIVT